MRDTYTLYTLCTFVHDTCREGTVKVEGKREVERERERDRERERGGGGGEGGERKGERQTDRDREIERQCYLTLIVTCIRIQVFLTF